MTWSTLRHEAHSLGFDVSYRSMTTANGGFAPDMLAAPNGEDWICIGAYEHLAGLWVRPLTDEARHLSRQGIVALMESCDHFVETPGEEGEEFVATCHAQSAAIEHPEWGMISF